MTVTIYSHRKSFIAKIGVIYINTHAGTYMQQVCIKFHHMRALLCINHFKELT